MKRWYQWAVKSHDTFIVRLVCSGYRCTAFSISTSNDIYLHHANTMSNTHFYSLNYEIHVFNEIIIMKGTTLSVQVVIVNNGAGGTECREEEKVVYSYYSWWFQPIRATLRVVSVVRMFWRATAQESMWREVFFFSQNAT